MGNVLVIEDDEYIRKAMIKLLYDNGYDADWADSVSKAYEKFNDEVKLVIVDVLLPDGDGFEICENIRKRSNTAIIFVTSCDDEESITKGLDIGADDYIVKPFKVAEFLSRVKANLRRIDFNLNKAFVIDDTQNIIRCRGKMLNLTPKEFALMRVLVANEGLIVKRELLLQKLWDCEGNFVEDGTLTVTVSRLKRKLEEVSEGTGYIETIRGVGYRLVIE